MAIKLGKSTNEAMKGMRDQEKWIGMWQYKKWKSQGIKNIFKSSFKGMSIDFRERGWEREKP